MSTNTVLLFKPIYSSSNHNCLIMLKNVAVSSFYILPNMSKSTIKKFALINRSMSIEVCCLDVQCFNYSQ